MDINSINWRNVLKDVIATFGIITDPRSSDAVYILKSGKILDTKGPYNNHQHENIANYITEKTGFNDLDNANGSKFLTRACNAVRLTPWLNAFYIPKSPMTEAQQNVLKDFIRKTVISKEKPLLIATYGGYQQIELTKKPADVDELMKAIMYYYIDGQLIENFIKKETLLEDNRTTLIAKSRNQGQYKDQSRGKNRFERKKYSKVANAVKAFNQIDMNDFFKKDILTVKVPVTGETDDYTVSIKIEGVVAEIARNVKNNKNKFEFRTVIQALTKMFNTSDIYVNCTCKDYRYNFDHWNIVNNVSTSDTAHDPGPGKGIANPQDNKGRGCKHVLLVLNNGDWMMKVASVINNYVHYAEEHMQKPFLKVIFPKIYGVPADEMVEQDLIDDDKYLDSSAGLIDAINEYGKKRGQYKPGTNKNPVTGTGGRAKKES